MLIVGFPAAAFGTNCYVVAPAEGEQCLVVDPGVDVVGALDDVLREHRLRPAAVLLTHGHLDHTFSVTPVCGARDVPAYIHGEDAHRLVDPLPSLGPAILAAFGGTLDWTEPDDVRLLRDGSVLELAGLDRHRGACAGPHGGVGAVRAFLRAPRWRRSACPATCCSPGPSDAPTCPAGTSPRC